MPVPVDPFDEYLRTPPDEAPEERAVRLAREEEARQVSAAIDASIKAERNARRKKRIVRLLLLGQSESGKSTTLRQFQRLYTPTAFREERILWRAVIQLNIVRSIRTILDALSTPTNARTSPQTSPYSSPRTRALSLSRNPALPELPGAVDVMGNAAQVPLASFSSPRHVPIHQHHHHNHHRSGGGIDSDGDGDSDMDYGHPTASGSAGDSPPFPPQQQQQLHHHHLHHHSQHYYTQYHANHIETLKSRLSPIRHTEQLLISKLVPPNEDEPTHLGNGVIGGNALHWATGSSSTSRGGNGEVFVRPTTGWRGALARAGSIDAEGTDETQETLNALCGDMIQLWQDPGVREVLKRRKIRLEEGSGFFLNDLQRVTSLRYMPSDDDVLKARLKTVGVAEYRFEMEVPMTRDTGTEWRIVDVGGSRTKATWAPFFDDVDAIIFLAPISGFDQVLTEDRTVNRLEDSVLLWKAVCSNKLLANVDLVLFLNKCDLLEAKLKSGIRLAKYVRSYGDRENDLDTVSKYMRSKFSAIHREHSPNPRKFYAFCTSVTDTTTTAGIIASGTFSFPLPFPPFYA
ncbi:Guanine nucleotide-binding protein alpha-4 subunit [Leucoagaricus sp. SymC.cos]|nr:Guanine nucleotide-binding protein alpha-4 subunit [Leucoagaricus sp. SymC.cos]